jgi:hypothetical protein
MKPQITWTFETIVAPLWFSSTETRTVPPETTYDEMVTQLSNEGHHSIRFVKKEWDSWAWPGGYPLYYVVADGGVLCAKCANDNLRLTLSDDPQWRIVGMDINYEDGPYCDHCNECAESAY